jgi:alpha-D-ribose 1-methylphosphonate 5-triphosphate synthase subunit PhnH
VVGAGSASVSVLEARSSVISAWVIRFLMVAWAVVGSTVTLTTSITASRPLRSALKAVCSRSMELATPMAASTGLRRSVSVVVAVLSSAG